MLFARQGELSRTLRALHFFYVCLAFFLAFFFMMLFLHLGAAAYSGTLRTSPNREGKTLTVCISIPCDDLLRPPGVHPAKARPHLRTVSETNSRQKERRQPLKGAGPPSQPRQSSNCVRPKRIGVADRRQHDFNVHYYLSAVWTCRGRTDVAERLPDFL